MRIAWRTVGSIIGRVWADVDVQHDRLAGLRRIGIDEISYKRGFKLLMVVVDQRHPAAGVGRAGTLQRHGAGVLRSPW
jgi:transposase